MLALLSQHVANRDVKTEIVIVWWIPTLEDQFLSYDLMNMICQELGKRFSMRICLTKGTADQAKKCKLSKLKNIEVVHGRQTEESFAWAKKTLTVKDDTKYSRAFIAGTDAFCEDMVGRFKSRFPNLRNRLFLL